MESYVGLDVHSKASVFVVQNAEGRVYARGEVATTPEGLARLRSEYGLAPGTPIGLETGTIAFYVAHQSGDSDRHGSITKRGSAELRAAMALGA